MLRKNWLAVCAFTAWLGCAAAVQLQAAETELITLWPEGAPGAVGEEDQDKPALWVYPATHEPASGTAVVICPGGGYAVHATDHEGTQIARFFNSKGITAFVLRYRLGRRYQHPRPLQDAQRAIRYVRTNAEKFGISPHRIGIMGFSAGGHLASTAATHFDNGQADATDPIEKASCRPDFAILGYAVISLSAPYAHRGSGRNLLGENPTDEQLKALSNDLNVTAETPPTFIFHTAEDAGVPVENAVAFFQALRQHKVPGELHIYQHGPHGVGLAPADPALNTWKDHIIDWLRVNGLLADGKRAPISGAVTVGGAPLRWGQIRFQPIGPGAEYRPVGFAMISNAKYQIDAAHGPYQGDYEIQIYDLGAVAPTPTIEDLRRLDAGQLRARISAEPNVFDISLNK